MIAFLLMLGQVENGFQSVLVAPTNVLAVQHYHEAKALLEPLGVRVAFLNGAVKVRERRKILKELEEGTIDVLVGTHACMGKEVTFKNLSIAVLDEEHRFGVKQREAIREKVANGIHMISMSATPIPRSLAVTLYGEHVSIHTIKSLPTGRKPVTISLQEDNRIPYDAISGSLKRGEQAYIVCPLIEESDNDAMKEVKSVEEVFAEAEKRFTKEGYRVAFISGNMKEDEVAETIQAFTNNEYQVLVSTTIIEVGVNVPNATTMVIQNAERFGSSQLWQLKGRVGRGSKPSVCHLISPNPNPLSKEKLEMICKAKDGFEVAKEDLRLRGAGSLLGEQQSGGNRYIQLMLQHATLNNNIRTAIKEILADKRRKKRYDMTLQSDKEVVEV
jgi:ATP-dependent DNA helicase RecG